MCKQAARDQAHEANRDAHPCGDPRLLARLAAHPCRSSKPRRRAPVLIGAAGALLAIVAAPALAQSPNMQLVRDAEIEALMRDYADPLLKASRVGAGATRIYLINDRRFNAFVAGGRNIFIHVGAIMESRTPNEIIGVIAHEIGHISGGHLARQRMALDRAAPVAIASMLLGAGALAASSRSRQVGGRDVGAIGALTGPQEMMRRAFLSYRRADEQAADIAAVRYLNATGQSARGLYDTLSRMSQDTLFSTRGMDPYLMSHPLPAERLSYLRGHATGSPHWNRKDPPALQARHDLVRAKLVGFVGEAGEAARRYPVSDRSLPAQYAHAIAAYRFGRLDDAIARIDRLIAARRNNPYFHELKGQALLERGRPAQAIAPLQTALKLAPRATPIRVMLGHALVSTGVEAHARQAIPLLTRASHEEPENAAAFQYLAMAYDALGNAPMSQLSAAQALFLAGKYVEARTQAARAKSQLKPRSPAWRKAEDILQYRPPDYAR